MNVISKLHNLSFERSGGCIHLQCFHFLFCVLRLLPSGVNAHLTLVERLITNISDFISA